MPKWMFWWGEQQEPSEQDEQEELNLSELLEQVERQTAIIEEQARQIRSQAAKIDGYKTAAEGWENAFNWLRDQHEAFSSWVKAMPEFKKYEVTE